MVTRKDHRKGVNVHTKGRRSVYVLSKFGGLRKVNFRNRRASGKKFKTRSCLTFWTPKGLKVAHCNKRSDTSRGRVARRSKKKKAGRARSPEY